MLLSLLAQPVMALAKVNLSRATCPMELEGCCGPDADMAWAPQEEDTGCCSKAERTPLLSDELGDGGCACQLDSSSFPKPDPALPTGSFLGSESQAASKWLQDQRTLFERIPSWMPWAADASVVTPGDPGALGHQGHAAAMQAGVVCHWQRLGRGLIGLLAILSFARL